MSARAWAFQQGILWAMELGRAQGAPAPGAEGLGRLPVDSTLHALTPTTSSEQAAAEPSLPESGRARSLSMPGFAGPRVKTSRLPADGGPQLHNATVPATASRGQARFDEVNLAALTQLARAMDVREPSELARRLDTGRRCFVGRMGDEIATYGWLSLRDESVGELERDYRVMPGEAYIWDCATLPAHRGSGLYGALLSHIIQTLQAEGIRRVWIGANLENEPSLRAFARAGFQPVVQVVYARLLRLSCLLLRAQPGAPVALVDCARAMLTEPYERAWRSLIFGVRPRGSLLQTKVST